MQVLKEVNKLSVSKLGSLQYEGKKIGAWWGKTLYHYDKANNLVKAETFSLFGLLFHLCGYKKEYSSNGLKDWLLANNLNINVLTNSKSTKTENLDIVKALRANDLKKTQFRRMCIDYEWDPSKALEKENEIIKLFEEGLDINAVIDSENTSVFHEACRRGKFKVAEYLLERGANPNTANSERSGLVARTPLHEAISHQNEAFTLRLIEKGVDLNEKNFYEESPLHLVIDQIGNDTQKKRYPLDNPEKAKNTKEVLKAMLERGPDLNVISQREGKSPLHKACLKGDLEVVKMLVEKGADPNISSKYGKTPLFDAVSQGNKEIVKYLIEHGANTRPVEPEPNAKIGGKKNWPSLIGLATGSEKMTTFDDRNWKPDPELIRLLVQSGADINALGAGWHKENTPLQIAVLRGDKETVKLLLELGADRSILNYDKKTALEIAQANNDLEIAALLSNNTSSAK